MSRSRRILLALVVLVVLMAVPVGIVIHHWTKPSHRADVLLEIRAPINLIWNDASESNDERNRKYVTDQIAFLKSDLVLESALEKFSAQSLPVPGEADPTATFASRIKVEQVGDSSFFRVGIIGRKKQMEDYRRIIEAVADVYLELRADREKQKRQQLTSVLHQLKNKQEEAIRLNLEKSLALKKAQEDADEQSLQIATELLFVEADLAQARNVWNLICERLTKLDLRGELPSVRLLRAASVHPLDEEV